VGVCGVLLSYSVLRASSFLKSTENVAFVSTMGEIATPKTMTHAPCWQVTGRKRHAP